MAHQDKKNHAGTKTAPAATTTATKSAAPASEVVVTETAAASTTAAAAAVPVAAAVAPAVPKVQLFWRKSCDSVKDGTKTEIKADEVFTRTSHKVMVDGKEETIYSLKRGKRIYYTPSSFITDEQRAAADLATDAKNKAKEVEDAKKADEKKKKEAEKAAKAADAAKITSAAPAADAAPAAEVAAK